MGEQSTFSDGPGGELLHCPKCGRECIGAYAVLGHIVTEHWILDDDELPEDHNDSNQKAPLETGISVTRPFDPGPPELPGLSEPRQPTPLRRERHKKRMEEADDE